MERAKAMGNNEIVKLLEAAQSGALKWSMNSMDIYKIYISIYY